jgi:hypothetical protein
MTHTSAVSDWLACLAKTIGFRSGDQDALNELPGNLVNWRTCVPSRRVGDELRDCGCECLSALLPGVEHVPTAEMAHGEAASRGRVEPHQVPQAIACVVRGNEVVPSVRDERLQVRVQRHPVSKVVGRAGGRNEEVALVVVFPFFVDLIAQQGVLAIRLDADLGAQLSVDRGRVRGTDSSQCRVGAAEGLSVREGISERDRRVVKPEDLALVS